MNTLFFDFDDRYDMNEFLESLNYRYMEYSLERTAAGWIVTYEGELAWLDYSLEDIEHITLEEIEQGAI